MPEPPFALPPQYNPHHVERRLYQRWLDRGVFTPRADSPHEPYVIVIPPPNVTAILHVGHGLNNVIQDVLIRFERMRGRAAEWLPGTDHAGIATQNVVERLLAEEGKTRFDLGREKFVERTWAFVRQTGNAILEQLKVIGCSCDWSRTRFTFARLPIPDMPIPILAAEPVDPAFGAGFVRVPPAHGANDFEIGRRHGLEAPLIMREDGTMGEEAEKAERRRGHPKRVPPRLV